MVNKPNRTRSSVFMHTQSQRVTIQWNITAMRYRNDVIWSVLLLHISANLRMMLARDYASCHAARSTLVMRVANNVHKLRWPSNSLDLLDLLKNKVHTQLLQLNLHAWYSWDVSAIPQQYIHRHILSMSTPYFAIGLTPGGCTKY